MRFAPSSITKQQWTAALLLGGLALAVFGYVYADHRLHEISEQRHSSRLLVHQLSQLTNRISLEALLYWKTGRPEDLGQISAASTEDDARVTGSDLRERMSRSGFTPDELGILLKALAFTDGLIVAEEAGAPGRARTAGDPTEALRRQYAEMAEAIDSVGRTSEARMAEQVRAMTDQAVIARNVLGVFLVISMPSMLMLFRLDRRMSAGEADSLLLAPTADVERCSDVNTQTDPLPGFSSDRMPGDGRLSLTASMLFAEAQEAMFLMDEQGLVIDVNDAYEAATGFDRQESIGVYAKVFESLQHEAGYYAELWAKLRRDGRWRGELWSRRRDGDVYANLLSISPILSGQGGLIGYLGILADITSIKRQQQEIERIAFHDPLTQLPNRPLLSERMVQALAQVGRSGKMMAVACLDLDGFKMVNDNHGHTVGDSLLIEVAKRLQGCVRSGDTVARLGGDEFAIVLSELTSKDDCEATLQRILKALVLPYNLHDQAITTISGSIGYTLYPEDTADADALLRHADHAMYSAKQAGKNCFKRHDISDDKRVQANWWALARIEKAMANREFRLHIQPKVNLRTGRVVGGEALIRWQHPIRGLIAPCEFLPLIDENDLAVELGDWVIEHALTILQGWSEERISLPLSVNVCARQLRDESFFDRLSALLAKYPGVSPRHLELEIVESAALNDMAKVGTLIDRCLGLGVRFALDDFGTGYSALTYLKRLSAATLKIDQGFVRNIPDDASDLAIVRGIIAMAQAFHKDIVAEGVENWDQARCLLSLGCEVAQGYVIARPMPVEAVLSWLDTFQLPDDFGGTT